MACGGLIRRYKLPDEEDQRHTCQGYPADDMETVHKCQELRLIVQLPVDCARRSHGCVWSCESFTHQIVCHCMDMLLKALRTGPEILPVLRKAARSALKAGGSWISFVVRKSASSPMGTLMKKIQRQL
jgi:hypothetical protein